MAFVEISLNSFQYRFRRLTWREELKIRFSKTEDQRLTFLAQALNDVSGLKITSPADATKILTQLPPAIFWRIWIMYQGGLPEDQFFSTQGLYKAPDQRTYIKRLYEDEQVVEEQVDEATRELQARFGIAEVRESRAVESQLFKAAKDAGKLTRAKEE
jgi:hypothetical protein